MFDYNQYFYIHNKLLLDIVVDHLMNLFWLEIEIEVVDTFYSLRMNKSIYIYMNEGEERKKERIMI